MVLHKNLQFSTIHSITSIDSAKAKNFREVNKLILTPLIQHCKQNQTFQNS